MAQSVRCVLDNRHKDLSSGPHVPTRRQAGGVQLTVVPERQTVDL